MAAGAELQAEVVVRAVEQAGAEEAVERTAAAQAQAAEPAQGDSQRPRLKTNHHRHRLPMRWCSAPRLSF